MIVLGKVTWDFRRHGKSTWGNDFLLQPEMKQVLGFGVYWGLACSLRHARHWTREVEKLPGLIIDKKAP